MCRIGKRKTESNDNTSSNLNKTQSKPEANSKVFKSQDIKKEVENGKQ